MKNQQTSLRLPVHVFAKVKAIQDLYPHLTRTKIIADLLESVLDDLEKNNKCITTQK